MANVIGLFSTRTTSLLRCPISRVMAQRLNMQINLIHTNPFNHGTPLIQAAIKLQQPTAFMSYDASNKIHNQIDNLIKQSKKKVFVFMKGDPEKPLCGYSGMVVQLLKFYEVDFDTCDVLDNEDIRREIKSYSDWPTIPQVYVEGTFLGGCDILLQMHQSGELKPMFTKEATPTTER